MSALTRPALLAYGFFGMPLALVALPIYVFVPQFYSERFGLSLTAIGTALLIARVFDAFIDPAIGLWIDRADECTGYRGPVMLSLPFLSIGFIALFHPPGVADDFVLAWFVTSLMLAYVGFSVATIAYQSWGAGLSGVQMERTRITATREACGLVGVVLAAIVPGALGIGWLSALFIVALFCGTAVLMTFAPSPLRKASVHAGLSSLAEPFRGRRFRWLFAVFGINGIAAAIPATLFLFFVRDRLQLADQAGLFLVLYFVAAAASMPLWIRLARRFGEARAWLTGMLLAIAAFICAAALPAGAAGAFSLICVMSGFALGADLALPPALLAGVIARAGHDGIREGAYFGTWNWATKMNLALAAGISLPVLGQLGYAPGVSDESGVRALGLSYAVLPCLLKLIAAAILWRAPLRDL